MSAQAPLNSNESNCRVSAILGMTLAAILTPLTGWTAQAAEPTCDALVSVANDLYLVSPTGKMITRFTSDSAAKMYATVSPDGREVAYVVPNTDENDIYRYHIATVGGRQRSFPVYTPDSDPRNPGAHDFSAMGPLMRLWWNSNGMLGLEKHVSPTASWFEFHRIDPYLAGPGATAGTGYGDNCAERRNGGPLACVQNSVVRVDDRIVFLKWGFPTTPIASFTVAKGSSATTPGSPTFTVAVVGFHQNQIGLDVTSPTAPAAGGQEYIGRDEFFTMWVNDVQYGFTAALVNLNTRLVRIQEFKGRAAGSSIFDSAIAWQPHGEGLLLIRRKDGQAILYLIQPRDPGEDGHGNQSRDPASSDARDSGDGHGRDHPWSLVAQAPIDLPQSVQSMRFVTPSMLLVQASNGAFSLVPIQIGNGRGKDGTATLTIGTVTQLPSTLTATINGSSAQTPALDWTCPSARHDGGGA